MDMNTGDRKLNRLGLYLRVYQQPGSDGNIPGKICFIQLQFPCLLHTAAKLSMIHRKGSQLSNETFP